MTHANSHNALRVWIFLITIKNSRYNLLHTNNKKMEQLGNIGCLLEETQQGGGNPENAQIMSRII